MLYTNTNIFIKSTIIWIIYIYISLFIITYLLICILLNYKTDKHSKNHNNVLIVNVQAKQF